MAIHGAQMPMGVSASPEPSPFDEPVMGETLILLAAGEVKGCYAVGDDLRPRQITPAQFVAAAECGRGAPPEPLPANTNERVMAAFNEFRQESSRRLGRLRRRRDTRNRRYLSRQLNLAREQAATGDGASGDGGAQDIPILMSIFLGDLPSVVESRITEIRSMQITGSALLARLRALRERYRLNPPGRLDNAKHTPQIIRIVCSDGLVE